MYVIIVDLLTDFLDMLMFYLITLNSIIALQIDFSIELQISKLPKLAYPPPNPPQHNYHSLFETFC